jgi:NADH-quinone oxidoreductase subunit M
MFNHGTSTSMLFLLVGVIYDRAHHRDVNGFGGLATQLPVYAGIFAVAVFASMGLPGLSGFISEILVFLGAFRSDMGSHSMISLSFQSMTIIAAGGVILAAAYLLWMLQRVFFGPLNEKYKGYADLSGRELLSLVPLVIVIVIFGVYPQPLIDLTYTSVNRTMQHVRNADMARRPAATTVLAATPKAGGAADAVKTGEAAEDTARIESAPEPRPQTVSAAQPAQLPRATAAASPATATP